MSGSFAIREARDADGPALEALIAGVFREYPGCWLAKRTEMPQLLRPRSWFRSHHGRWWVAELGGRVAGCIAAAPELRAGAVATVELKHLYVAAASRRQGLGARLCDLVDEFAAARGAARLVLWSDTRFTDAHRLYERLGWTPTGRMRALNDTSLTREREFVRTAPRGARSRGG